MKLLVSYCPQDIDLHNIWGVTPLLYAAQFKQTECARALILTGADVNATDSVQRSVLHHACKKRAVDIVKVLVRRGTSLDVSDQDAATPLMDAISVNCAPAVLALIQGGCNVDVVGKATVRGRYLWSTPFQAALKNRYFTCAKMLYFSGCPLGEPEDNMNIVDKEDIMDNEEWVADVFRVPRNLSIWCRSVIHKCLGRSATSKAKALPLPKGLQLFVAYYDLALLTE